MQQKNFFFYFEVVEHKSTIHLMLNVCKVSKNCCSLKRLKRCISPVFLAALKLKSHPGILLVLVLPESVTIFQNKRLSFFDNRDQQIITKQRCHTRQYFLDVLATTKKLQLSSFNEIARRNLCSPSAASAFLS